MRLLKVTFAFQVTADKMRMTEGTKLGVGDKLICSMKKCINIILILSQVDAKYTYLISYYRYKTYIWIAKKNAYKIWMTRSTERFGIASRYRWRNNEG